MAAAVRKEEIVQKMAELGIEGWSSMGHFTPEDQMQHLEEIQRVLVRRKRNAPSPAKGTGRAGREER